MRLSQASDFALRILMLLTDEPEPLTVDEIARRLRLVKSHLMKITAKLTKAGILTSIRGRSGGVTLGREPKDISVGDVVRVIETDFNVVECMRPGKSSCVFSPQCRLRKVMDDARSAFLDVLDTQNLRLIAPAEA